MSENAPKLRFPEYIGKWEEKRLDSVSEHLQYGLNSAACEYDGENGYIRITDIDTDGNYIKSSRVSPKGVFSNEYLMKEGDILFARTGASTGKSYRYRKNDGNLFYAGFLIRARIKKEYNHEYVYYSMKTNRYENWVKLMSMRSGQPGINANEYSSYVLFVPTKSEQDKLAALLSTLDSRITIQSDKINTIRELKKGYMQKIFSQEIRFKREDGSEFPEWKKKRIDDVFDITRGIVIAKTSISDKADDKNQYPVYSSQTTNYGILGYTDIFRFEGDYLTWTTDGANAGRVFNRSGRFNCTNVCGVLVEKPDTKGFCNNYVAEALNQVTPKHVSYVGNPKLMNNVMAEIKVDFPCVEEQQKISDFLSTLESKSDIETQILSTLQTLKKGLLQQMFI